MNKPVPNNASVSARVLVDTSVLLIDPEVLSRIHGAGGAPFLTSTVLDELDFQKQRGDEVVRPHARRLLREFARTTAQPLTALPDGGALTGDDGLNQFQFEDSPVYILNRDRYTERTNNDGKIIALAQDYGMVLITRDNGMKTRAQAKGVQATLWTPPPTSPASRQSSGSRPQKSAGRPRPAPFALASQALAGPETALTLSGGLPQSGDSASLAGDKPFKLGARVSAGGEGTIYETPWPDRVCKIYHANRLTEQRRRKLELMVSRRINRPGLCWPTALVHNAAGEFVGYLMPRAQGLTLQSAMFVKPRLLKNFPDWTRRDLVNVALAFVRHVRYLHGLNILIGDINPQNLLVTEDSRKLWIVDTDSFQVEGYPCPVGTVNFTAPELQGKALGSQLRTKDHELFAVATMVFMILFPGKTPFSQQGGGDPGANIRTGNFPYFFFEKTEAGREVRTENNAPRGPWQFIWGNLPQGLREALFKTFQENQRTSLEDWIRLLTNYTRRLDNGTLTNELFPRIFRDGKLETATCAVCNRAFQDTERHLRRLGEEGKPLWCPTCRERKNLERMARQSARSAPRISRQPHAAQRPNAGPARAGKSGYGPGRTQRPSARQGAARRSATSFRGPPRPAPGGASGNVVAWLFRFLFKS